MTPRDSFLPWRSDLDNFLFAETLRHLVPTIIPQPLEPGRMPLLGHFERFTPSAPSDRNEFIKETLASPGATDDNAPEAAINPRPAS
jgi:hypothetical protein